MWKQTFLSIYNSHDNTTYLKDKFTMLQQKVNTLTWKVTKESLIQRLRDAHTNGYFGFHFIDEIWDPYVVDSYISHYFDGEKYVKSRSCIHNKTCLYIDPFELGIKPNISVYKKYPDFCHCPL